MILTRLRRKAGSLVIRTGLEGLSRITQLHPRARRAKRELDIIRNVRYHSGDQREHVLDIYRQRPVDGPGERELRPALLYVHGGGFRLLSKETHWMMGLAFARRGYVVFNIDYRLAPRYPYPSAIEDACQALVWLTHNAAQYGADPTRLALVGESAGANLVTALTVAACLDRPEPWARTVYAANPNIRAVIPACGILQVSNPERFGQRRKIPRFIEDRIVEVSQGYLRGYNGDPRAYALADPLVVLEQATAAQRPLPPMFAFAGTRDPVMDDTRRLQVAVQRLGGSCETKIYPNAIHAFHALIWQPQARECWRDQFGFLEGRLGR